MKKLIFSLSILMCAPAFSQAVLISCMNRISEDESLSSLKGKVPLGVIKDHSFEMLANVSYASEAEKAALSRWMSLREGCYEESDSEMRNSLSSELIDLLEKNRSDFKLEVVDLYSGKVTFGQFNKNCIERKAKFDLKWGQASAQKASVVARQQEADDQERRQAAVQLLANQKPFQPYQMPVYQMPVPKTTHCTTFGNQTNCATR